MNRHQLDALAGAHRFSPRAGAAALALTGQRPDPAAWRAFGAAALQAAGLGALGAGVIFFVAANWQALGVLGRFALLQAALLTCVGIALWRPPPHRHGVAASIGATLVTGALLALFGQSYQTGADLHELFFAWAALALPFALAGGSGGLWALWWGVLNVALALLCGWLGADHAVWRLLAGRNIGRATALMLPFAVNLAGAVAFAALRRTRMRAAAPRWLVEALIGTGVLFGTAASIAVVTAHGGSRSAAPIGAPGVAVLLGYAAGCAAIAWATLRRRGSVFPLAAVAAGGIAVSTAWLVKSRGFDIGGLFLLAGWLVVSSTLAGAALLRCARAWAPAGASLTSKGES